MKHIENDPLVEKIISAILKQANKGLQEYGIPLSKAGLTLSQSLEMALEEGIDRIFYLADAIQKAKELESKPGENTNLSTPHPPLSNATEIRDHLKGTGQEPYDLLAQSIIAQHTPFDSTELRRIWLTIFNDKTGRSLCREIREAIKTGEGIESLKPNGDPAEKLKTIRYVQATDPGFFERAMKKAGISTTFNNHPKPRNN